MGTLAAGGPDIVEVPPSADLEKLLAGEEGELFMNEKIDIICRSNADPHAPKAVEIHIDTGGITGPMTAPCPEFPYGKPGVAGRGGRKFHDVIPYDRPVSVPRFVFEVMAHSKTTRLVQTPHPTIPMELMQQQIHTYSYNFECVRDPNPKGQKWREKVMADRA
jgi:hypothetical protein